MYLYIRHCINPFSFIVYALFIFNVGHRNVQWILTAYNKNVEQHAFLTPHFTIVRIRIIYVARFHGQKGGASFDDFVLPKGSILGF